jgi:rRNA maturation endonuclease Nob1
MIKFKCKECGEKYYSSCINIEPCQECGGELEVHSIDNEEEKDED